MEKITREMAIMLLYWKISTDELHCHSIECSHRFPSLHNYKSTSKITLCQGTNKFGRRRLMAPSMLNQNLPKDL